MKTLTPRLEAAALRFVTDVCLVVNHVRLDPRTAPRAVDDAYNLDLRRLSDLVASVLYTTGEEEEEVAVRAAALRLFDALDALNMKTH